MEATLEAPAAATEVTPVATPAATTPTPAAPVTPAATPAAPTLLDGAIDPASPEAPANPLNQTTPPKWLNDDGTFTENWRSNFKDEALRNDSSLSRFKNVEDFAKSFVESRKMIGQKLAREAMPLPDAPPEKLAEWRKLTGAPDSPTGYGELRPDNVPKEQWDAELEGGLRSVAHKYGAPPALVKELAEAYTSRQFALQQAQVAIEAQRLEKGSAELREEFGADYQRQIAYAAQGAAALGFDPADPEQRAFFLNPKAVKNFARAFQMNFMGDRAEGGKDGANGYGGGVDDRIADVRKSPAYKGDEGPARQKQAQDYYHQLLDAKTRASQPMTIRKSA